MEKLPHYHFSWIVSFQKQRSHICKMRPLETKLSGGKILPQSDLRRGVFLGETSSRRYDKKEFNEQKEYRSYKALDRTMWRNRFGGGFGPVVRQTTE